VHQYCNTTAGYRSAGYRSLAPQSRATNAFVVCQSLHYSTPTWNETDRTKGRGNMEQETYCTSCFIFPVPCSLFPGGGICFRAGRPTNQPTNQHTSVGQPTQPTDKKGQTKDGHFQLISHNYTTAHTTTILHVQCQIVTNVKKYTKLGSLLILILTCALTAGKWDIYPPNISSPKARFRTK